jgi:hypothetical protein
MSRHNGNGEEWQGTPDVREAQIFCAIEDHAKTLGVSFPVYAAVLHSKGWAVGKKVEKAEFEKAVKDFLNAPAGGVKDGFSRH